MRSRPELIVLRDGVIRHLHGRASVDEVEELAIEAGRQMKKDGLSLEEMIVLLKGSVTLALERVETAVASERASALRSQITPWVLKMYVRESGDFTKPRDS